MTNIKQLIEQRVRIEILKEGIFSNLFSRITKDIQDSRVKRAQKEIEKTHPELSNAVEKLKKSMEIVKTTYDKILEEDPDAAKLYQDIADFLDS
jgi:esterase/lipase